MAAVLHGRKIPFTRYTKLHPKMLQQISLFLKFGYLHKNKILIIPDFVQNYNEHCFSKKRVKKDFSFFRVCVIIKAEIVCALVRTAKQNTKGGFHEQV